ncbi:MAG: DUF748 domain-containing protein [Myxococcota bacterium]|nr:DUF748 domain-containing protein [Myxococcota bacterium]
MPEHAPSERTHPLRRIPLVFLLGFVSLLLVLGVLTLALERYSQTPAMRDHVEKLSVSLLGRPLSYKSLQMGLWPPHLSIRSATLPGPDQAGPDLLTITRLDLRIAIAPLIRKTVLFESLTIDGLDVRMVRNDSGLDSPWSTSSSLSNPEETSPSSEESWFSSWGIRFRQIKVREARFSLIDKTRSPPETFGFESVNLIAKSTDTSTPLDVDFKAESIGGGEIQATGTSALNGDVALRFGLTNLSLSGLGSYLDSEFITEATLSGNAEIKGPIADPKQLKLDVQLAADRVQWEADSLKGSLALQGDFDDLWPKPKGTLTLEAKQAAISISKWIVKPAGTSLHLVSEWGDTPNSDWAVSLNTIEIATIKASGRVGWEPSFYVQLDSEEFPVKAIALLVPELSDSGAHGRLEIKDLVYQSGPPSVQGTLRAEDLHVVFQDGGSISLSVDLTGQGDGIAIEKGDLSAGGQHFEISGQVTDLAGELPFDIKVKTPQTIRADAFLTGLSPNFANVLYGPATLNAQISGSGSSLGTEAAFFDSFNGEFNLEMGQAIPGVEEGGRIVGFSLLSSLFDGLGKYSQITRVTRLLLGDKTPDLTGVTDDSFEKARLISKVENGVCVIEKARIVESSYAANLVGNIRLADLSLDLRGKIELGEAAAAALGARAKDGEIVVPVAHIRGTLDDPKVDVSESAVLSLSTQLVSNNVAIKTVLGGTDKVIPGAGSLLGNGLNTLLGGKRLNPSEGEQEPQPEAEKDAP